MIDELEAQGITSLGAIAQALNEREIPTARGGKWTPIQVSRTLYRLSR
ncbi:recombinase family protein [Microvirga aerilata]|nr:recombinase family protein [Microvirga aerilata]